MIIGNGMLAKSFLKYNSNDVIVFASGVSNSKINDEQEFLRERNLLESVASNSSEKTLIYFSSCSLNNNILSRDAYHSHKLFIENWINENVEKYVIFRLPNVIGPQSNKTNTLLPFLIHKIKNNQSIPVWSGAIRNIIDVEHISIIVDYIVKKKMYLNSIINVANSENIKILELIKILESYFGIKSRIDLRRTPDENFSINIEQIVEIAKECGIEFGANYILEVLRKYY